MAVRFQPGIDDNYRSLTTVGDTYTVIFWFRPTATTGQWQRIVDTPYATDDSNNQWMYLGIDNAFTNVIQAVTGGSHINVVAVQAGVWFRGAITRSGTGIEAYAGPEGSTLSKGTRLVPPGDSLSVWIGGRGNELFDGRIAAFRMYNAVLTQAEIENEHTQYLPIRTANLTHFYDFLKPDPTDYSGNSNTLTSGAAAPTVEDGPPIPWGTPHRQLILPAPTGGGTPVTLTDTPGAAVGRTSDQVLIRGVTVTDRVVAAAVGYPTQTLVVDQLLTDRPGGTVATGTGQALAVDTGPPVVLADRPAAAWATPTLSNFVKNTVLANRAGAATASAPAATLAVDRTVTDWPTAIRTAGGVELAVNTTSVTDQPGAITAATPRQTLLIEIIRLDRPGAALARGTVSRRIGDLVLVDYPIAVRAGHVTQGVAVGDVLTNWPPTVTGPFIEPLVTIRVGPRSPMSQSSARCAGGDR